jgi:hypothetical protein
LKIFVNPLEMAVDFLSAPVKNDNSPKKSPLVKYYKLFFLTPSFIELKLSNKISISPLVII